MIGPDLTSPMSKSKHQPFGQLFLFQTGSKDSEKSTTNLERIYKKTDVDHIYFDDIPVSMATFKSGVDKPVHGWFRLTPSFGPELVQIMLEKMTTGRKNGLVLDPYSGASTTLIECKQLGIPSVGIEINPLLHFVGKISLNPPQNAKKVSEAIENIVENFSKQKYTVEDLENGRLEIPPIHNPLKWWRKDVLFDLLVLRKIVNEYKDAEIKNLLLLALAAVLVPDLSNVTLGKLQLHFIDRNQDEIDVTKTWAEHARRIANDIGEIDKKFFNTKSELILGDSTDLALRPKYEGKVEYVVTSPPYPNRYSYVWNTRPHLFFLGFFENAKQSSMLDLKTIGGTWGTATSSLAKGIVEPEFEVLRKTALSITDLIREKDNLMANYVMKYFNDLTRQVKNMDPLLTPNAKVAYVVGCSKIKGVRVETDLILSDVFKGLNLDYRETEVHRFRKRNSGKNLFESIVYAVK